MKTRILNEKTSRCETCKRFCKFIPSGVIGHCNLHKHVIVNVYGDSSCNCHENKPVSYTEGLDSVTPFSLERRAEQRKFYAKLYNARQLKGVFDGRKNAKG